MGTMEVVSIAALTPLAVSLVAAEKALPCLHWTGKPVMV